MERNWKIMSLYGFFKFLVGFILVVLLLVGVSVVVVFYFVVKFIKIFEKLIF